MGYLLILAVEELLDMCNRATMRDVSLHPVSRQIAKIHVLEEARHLSFAKTFLLNVWPTLPADERADAAALAPAAVGFVAELMVNGDVYRTLGIVGGTEAARSNPAHQERIVGDLSKLVGFLEDLGVIDEQNRGAWVARGLTR